jgi:methylmalonyl-CoA mutase
LLRKQGCKSTVVLAGYPSDHVDMLHAAGVDEFLHVRSNALELLTKLLSNAGVTL